MLYGPERIASEPDMVPEPEGVSVKGMWQGVPGQIRRVRTVVHGEC